jgi:hypothetical protein
MPGKLLLAGLLLRVHAAMRRPPPGHLPARAGAWQARAASSQLCAFMHVLKHGCHADTCRATADGDNQFDNWFTWIVIPCFLASAVFWVTRLNKVGARGHRQWAATATSCCSGMLNT